MTRLPAFSGILPQLEPPSLVFEIGAHRGADVQYFLDLWPDTKIVAFEAEPNNYALCAKRFKDDDRVTVENLAVTDECGPVIFHKWYDESKVPQDLNIKENFHYNLTGQGSLLEMSAYMRKLFRVSGEPSTLVVEGTTLDHYCGACGLWPDYVFMDIQGGEGKALAGAPIMLSKVEVLVLEWSEAQKSLYVGETPKNGLIELCSLYSLEAVEFEQQLKGISGDVMLKRKVVQVLGS